MSESPPSVSVVMPVYNAGEYLRAALESLLAQTFRDFEVIAVDDGSTDGSASLLAEYARREAHIVILTHAQNQGIVAALNDGLQAARGRYIARMDADDLSLPERFERQVEFLDAHPEVGILGSEEIFIDPQGQQIGRMSHLHDDLSIRWASLLSNVFFHPTVMLRRSVLTDHQLEYQAGIRYAQDYDLWVRLLRHTRAANLEQALVWYRVYPESISSRHRQEQMEIHARISLAHLQRTFPEFQITPEEHTALAAAFTGKLSPSQAWQRPALARRYLELWQAFARQHAGDPVLAHLRHEAVVQAAKIGLYPPFQPGWLGTTRGLFAADPLWGLYFAAGFPHMVQLKLRARRLRRLRAGSQAQHG